MSAVEEACDVGQPEIEASSPAETLEVAYSTSFTVWLDTGEIWSPSATRIDAGGITLSLDLSEDGWVSVVASSGLKENTSILCLPKTLHAIVGVAVTDGALHIFDETGVDYPCGNVSSKTITLIGDTVGDVSFFLPINEEGQWMYNIFDLANDSANGRQVKSMYVFHVYDASVETYQSAEKVAI